jgi:hypothetical protein
MKEGATEEDTDVDIEIPPNILKNILDNSRKRKADGSIDCGHCKVHVSEITPGEDLGNVEGDRKANVIFFSRIGPLHDDNRARVHSHKFQEVEPA